MTVDLGWIGFASLFVVLGALPASQAVVDLRARRFVSLPVWAFCVLASVYLGAHSLAAALTSR